MRRGWDVPRRCLQRALSSMGVSSEQELCVKVLPAASPTCPCPEEKQGDTTKKGGRAWALEGTEDIETAGPAVACSGRKARLGGR